MDILHIVVEVCQSNDHILKELKYATTFFCFKSQNIRCKKIIFCTVVANNFIHRCIPVSMVNSINHSYQGQNIPWRIFLVQDYTFSNFKTKWCYMCSLTSTQKTAHYSFWIKASIRCRGYVKYRERQLQRCFLMEHPRRQWLHTSECIDQPYLVCMND